MIRMIGKARNPRDCALSGVKRFEFCAVFEIAERGDGIVGQIQFSERQQRGKRCQIGDGIVGQIERFQLLQADQRVNLRHSAAGQVQTRQFRQRYNGVHGGSRDRAAAASAAGTARTDPIQFRGAVTRSAGR